MALAGSAWRESSRPVRRASRLRTPPPAARCVHAGMRVRCAAGCPLMARSWVKMTSIRFTASSAIGETTTGLLLRALEAISARTKNFRLPCAQQAASVIGAGPRTGSYSPLNPARRRPGGYRRNGPGAVRDGCPPGRARRSRPPPADRCRRTVCHRGRRSIAGPLPSCPWRATAPGCRRRVYARRQRRGRRSNRQR